VGEGTNDKIQRGTGDVLNRLRILDDQKKELRRRECRMRARMTSTSKAQFCSVNGRRKEER
jgi:hypothetical protein